MGAPLLIRRAQGGARDVDRVAALLRAHDEPVGEALAAALREDRWGVVLVAERAGVVLGALVLRFVYPVGAGAGEPPKRGFIDGVFARDEEVRAALREGARAELEARELEGSEPTVSRVDPAAAEGDRAPPQTLWVADGVSLRFQPGGRTREMVTRWSGGGAFRARWREDLKAPSWSVEGCVGAEDDEGDSMRFAREDRALREVYLTRPSVHSKDAELLERVRELTAIEGTLSLSPEADTFSLPRTRLALFDVSLDVFAALCDEPAEGTLRAVALNASLALLFVDDRYAGWRVRDPVSQLRPMGWADVQEGAAPTCREALTAAVHDWMAIDATTRPRPDEVSDPEEIAHMTTLRARVRALAAQGDVNDPTAGVARDLGAHIHWGWGFYRVPDEG